MDIRVSKATAVIVHKVPGARRDAFLDWQKGVTEAVASFAGYRSTDIFPPGGGAGGEWVVLVNFDEEASLQHWLTSPVRRQWVERFQAEIGGFNLQVAPGGFGAWFSGCLHDQGAVVPPAWKMVLVVLLGLYPTVMLLTLFPGPFLQPLGLAVSMLIGNALSVSILQWAVMPVLTSLSASWMAANEESNRMRNRVGTLLLVIVLIGLTLCFRTITG